MFIATLFVAVVSARDYDAHLTTRRLHRKKRALRHTNERVDDQEEVQFWTRLMKVGSMPEGVSHSSVILYIDYVCIAQINAGL